jgi:REP element-mobilizing transposase RayT
MNRRRLPHLHLIGQPLFITFRLHNSLPANRPFPSTNLTSSEAFLTVDRLLDQARAGPTFLRMPNIAEIVLGSIRYGADAGHYRLHACVIMPNHVHLLMTPLIEPSRLLGSLKGTTAKRANLLLARTGRAFWQDESFDRVVRSGDEFKRIERYIESNPVAAGLVSKPEDYEWSSAGRAESTPQAAGLPPNLPPRPATAPCRTSLNHKSPDIS